MIKRVATILVAAIQIVVSIFGLCTPKADEYVYVFVHGLGGWGESDGINKLWPHWGMMTGSISDKLEAEGYECCAASVGPISSAWDRACELYAQLAGTTVDYGKVHSEKYNHERYGQTFDEPLFEGWSENKKINLLGHSFGGATIRLFTSLAAYGSEEEQNATDESDLSQLFKGGFSNKIHSVTSLSAPHNGTTCFLTTQSEEETHWLLILTMAAGIAGNIPIVNGIYDFQLSQFGITSIPGSYEKNIAHISEQLNLIKGMDHAGYDLSINGASALNKTIKTAPDVLYFSYASYKTQQDENGNHVPDDDMTAMFKPFSKEIGKARQAEPYPGDDKIMIDEKWLMNDGLVNTISAKAPFWEPQQDFDPSRKLEPGIWNIMPLVNQDHLFWAGGMLKFDDTIYLSFYKEMFSFLHSTINK